MFNDLFILSIFMTVSGIYSFILNNTHLLNTLLCLEMIRVSIYFVLTIVLLNIKLDLFLLLYFLIIVVREGVLGLSLLICATYSYGQDYFKGFNSLTC